MESDCSCFLPHVFSSSFSPSSTLRQMEKLEKFFVYPLISDLCLFMSFYKIYSTAQDNPMILVVQPGFYRLSSDNSLVTKSQRLSSPRCVFQNKIARGEWKCWFFHLTATYPSFFMGKMHTTKSFISKMSSCKEN